MMTNKNYKYIYGPVPSWRLGSSLGIDPISAKEKICTFDCVYCQIGKTRIFNDNRKVFVSVKQIIEELHSIPSLPLDYITFSGAGEPTLAKNLGQMIKAVRELSKTKIAVITNSSLINREDVQKDLSLADFVLAKLDASSPDLFNKINRPLRTINFNTVKKAVKELGKNFKGKLALQIMFMEKNKKYAEEIAQIAKEINPDEVEINTPLRPCAVKPLAKEEIKIIQNYFQGLNTISVYESQKKKVKSLSNKDTLKRRGKVKV